MEKKIDENKLLDDEQLDAVAGGTAALPRSKLFHCRSCGYEAWYDPLAIVTDPCPKCGDLMVPAPIIRTAE